MKNFLEKNVTISIPTLIFILATVISFSITVGYITGVIYTHPNKIDKIIYTEKEIKEKYVEEFSEHNLMILMKKLRIKHTDIVRKQAIIESSHYSGKIFKENNNIYGIRYPNYRITTAIKTKNNHANYETWQDSVIDYAIYQSTFLRGKNKEEYLSYLKDNYAENKLYVDLINKIN